MKKILSFSVHHPVSVMMYFMLICLLGLISIFSLDINFLPQIKERTVLIKTEYPGVAADEIRKLITIPVEEIVTGVKGIKNIQSVSRDGVSLLELELDYGHEIQNSMMEIKSVIESSTEKLPEDCPRPSVIKKNSVQNNFMTLALTAQNEDVLVKFSRFAEDEFKPKLLLLEGMNSVQLSGCIKEEIRITVDSKKASFYSLSLEEICRTLNSYNYEYPAGTVKNGEDEILLKTEGTFKSLQEILETPFAQKSGCIYLKDFAGIQKKSIQADLYEYYNGKPCITMTLYRKENSNPIRLSQKISALIKEYNDRNSSEKIPEIKIVTDSTKGILDSLYMMIFSAAAGFFITFLILRFFFKSDKLALFAAAVIPFNIFWTAFVLMIFKYSINMISLSGITICLGMIIDNCIISITGVIKSAKKGGGKNFDEAVISGIEKTLLSSSASTLTTVIVFLPLFFIKGILGELFKDLALTVFSGMIFSLFFSWTVIPAACRLFFKDEIKNARPHDFSRLNKKYLSLLKKLNVGKKNIFIPATGAFILLSLICIFPIKKEVQGKTKADSLEFVIRKKPGTKIENLKKSSIALSDQLLKEKDIDSFLIQCGFDRENPDGLSDIKRFPEQIRITVFSKKIQRAREACKKILSWTDGDFAFTEKKDLVSQILNFDDSHIVFSESQEGAREISEKFFPGKFVPDYIKSQMNFIGKKNLFTKHEISALEFSSMLKDSLDGINAFPYYENGNEIPIKVSFTENEFDSREKLERLVILPGKSSVVLSSLGSFQEEKNEGILFRYDKKDAKIVFNKNPAYNDSLSIKKKLLSEIFSSGAFLLAVIFLLLYCLLGAQTQSFITPLIFLTAVPPAIFGGEFFLLIFAESVNINSFVAFIVLFGTAVNNSIIIFEENPFGSKIENISASLPSLLSTSGTSIAALIPFAFDPLHLNAQSSMSLALAGGLFVSTAAALIIVPDILLRREK